MSPTLDYRSADHTYWLDKSQIPGATRILDDLGAYPGKGFFTENSRLRGQAMHSACHLADVHCPDAATLEKALEVLDVAESIQPYLAGHLLFRREKRYIATAGERPLYSSRLRVGGIPDSWGKAENIWTVVDRKSWATQGAKPKHSAEIQTALYAIMIREYLGLPSDEIIQRWIVKLSGDGVYRCYECTNQGDYEEANWCARLWHRWHDAGIFKFSGDPDQVMEATA